MRSDISNILAAFESAIWGITPQKYQEIRAFLVARANGASTDQFRAAGRPTSKIAGRVALLPLNGCIAHHASMEMEISGGTSTAAFGRAFDDAVKNPDIGAIVIDCDSPGGSVEGVPELAAKIYEARGKKPIIAVANANMNSAAYWIASAADEVVAIPSANVGSVGVFCVHTDTSKMEADLGIKRTVIAFGDHKAENAPGVPLSEDGQAALQGRVDEIGKMFVGDCAKHRKTSVASVMKNFGQGRSVSAATALAAGMIDRVATMDDVLGDLAARSSSNTTSRFAAAIGARTMFAAAKGETFDAFSARVLSLVQRGIAANTPAPVTVSASACPECGGAMQDGQCTECDYKEPESIPATDEGPEAAARGASTSSSASPANQPAHQARSHSMSDQDTAQRAEAVRAAREAETLRVREISALCADHSVAADKRDAWLSSDISAASVAQEILKTKKAETANTTANVRSGGGASVTDLRHRADNDPRRGFATHRDFALAVMENSGLRDRADVSDERLRPLAVMDKEDKVAAGDLAYILPRAFTPGSMQAAVGSDEQGGYADRFGGFLAPNQVMPGMLSLAFEGDPTAGLTQGVPMGAPSVTFNARTDKDHTTSVSGGFTVTRRPETVTATSSRMETEQITLKATSLFGLAFATEEILTDSPISFAAIIDSGFRDQFPAAILNEKIRGNGGAEFLGVLNSPAKISVAKETGQAADTIVYLNVIKMASRCWGLGQSIWTANHDTRPQLSVLQIPVGVGGQLIYQPSPSAGMPDMLLGRPIYYTEYAGTIGDEGDLMLVNWSQYLEGTYQPLQSAESVHVRFVNHERAFKLWVRNCGAPWWRSALTPAKSTTTMSPIVTLAAR